MYDTTSDDVARVVRDFFDAGLLSKAEARAIFAKLYPHLALSVAPDEAGTLPAGGRASEIPGASGAA